MKTSMRNLVIIFLGVISTLLLSWNRAKHPFVFIPPIAGCPFIMSSYEQDDGLSAELESPAYDAENDWAWENFDADTDNDAPSAEDVLVQRIPGDDYHLIMMAVYSDFNEPSFVKEFEGEDVEFRDDGKGFDKVAGDGVYTAKIFADVKEFRKTAIQIDEATKKAGPVVQFQRRALYYAVNACNTEPFSADKLDKFEAVSIAALNSADFSKLVDSVRKNCIFMTDLRVVEDPDRTWNYCTQTGNINGPWTFKTLFKELATKDPKKPASDSLVSAFAKDWLNNWATKKVINADVVLPRTFIKSKILDPWLAKSQAAGSPAGQLDMRFAPFKLTAIVNRFDLRERDAGIPAGEARFTFCLINSNCTNAELFNIVIEYGIPKNKNCDTLRDWATQWFNLKNFQVGSAGYNSALQAITDQYTKAGQNKNKKTGSCLNTIRTNERALGNTNPSRWEFRQFVLDSLTHFLRQSTMNRLFQDKYNAQVDNPEVRAMTKWVNANREKINKDNYNVPAVFEGFNFLAGVGHILDTPVGDPAKVPLYHWDATKLRGVPEAFIKNNATRNSFSINTCTGCHAGEMQTFFTHVDPVFFGKEATLSGFLTGRAGRGGAVDFDNNPNNDSMMVKDAALRPTVNPKIRMFNDILRRAKDLKNFALSPPCATAFALKNDLMFQPVGMVH